MDVKNLTRLLNERASALGFDQTGVAVAGKIDGTALGEWLDRSCHGSMDYMARHYKLRLDPTLLLPGARSVIVLAINYYQPAEEPGTALFSRYAWGNDYHLVLRKKLQQLLQYMKKLAPGSQGRAFVDSGPVMEKVWATRAGIGWQGKHSLVVSPHFGSWIFLCEIITDLELEPGLPLKDCCGTCCRCIDACPTNAIIRPYMVDARRCISYNTIELSPDKPVPLEIAVRMGGRLFGCDICQEVCPWNKKQEIKAKEKAFEPRPEIYGASQAELNQLTEAAFNERFHHSAILRMTCAGLRRNLAAVRSVASMST